MLRKIPVFLYAFAIGAMIRIAVGQVAGILLTIVPETLYFSHPYADFALRAPFLALAETAGFAGIGFTFWSGSDESWPATGIVVAIGATLCGMPLWGVPSLGQPYVFALVVSARLAGAFLGPWYGDRTEHDPALVEVRNMLFRLYPLRLPR